MNALQLTATKKAIPRYEKVLIFPNISINGIARTVKAGGMPVSLTAKEFGILYLLACAPEETLPADEIYRRIWDMDDLGNIYPVRVHISNLRDKLSASCPGHEFIATIWRNGYRFISGPEVAE